MMRIALDLRHPTPSHCDVAVFVNGALAGVLTLRQAEIVEFRALVVAGAVNLGARIELTGSGEPPQRIGG